MTDAVQLLVGTRKGAWIYRSDARRETWRAEGPLFLGQIINHFVADPRDGRTLVMAASTGHLGPTILRSADGGATWTEASRPKRCAGAIEIQRPRISGRPWHACSVPRSPRRSRPLRARSASLQP